MTSTKVIAGFALGLALGGCGSRDEDQPVNEATVAAEANGAAEAAANAAAAAAAERASPDAAAEILRSYVALAQKRDFAGAADFWSDPADAAQFAADLDDYPKVAMSVGKPGDMEGAAGSSFIKVPVAMDLTLRSGSPYAMTCTATLRRVNDVPGASEKQLRWNIQSIDC